jgi:hypothetical protein
MKITVMGVLVVLGSALLLAVILLGLGQSKSQTGTTDE